MLLDSPSSEVNSLHTGRCSISSLELGLQWCSLLSKSASLINVSERCGSAGHGSADAGGELGGGGGGAFFMSTSTKRNKASCPAAARTVALV